MRVLGHFVRSGYYLIVSATVISILALPYALGYELAVNVSADIEGSADPGFLKRFPYSQIVAYENPGEIVSHELVYGSLKKINSVLLPERSLITEGQLTRITYRVADGVRSSEVIKHYQNEIENKGDVMFFCQRRNCGSSIYWANNVFGKGLLYGPEEYQNLLVARVAVNNRKFYVSIYAIQRGNQDGYVHLEIVEIAKLMDRSPRTLVEELQSFGFLVIDDVGMATRSIAMELTPQLKLVAGVLQANPELRVRIVARSERGATLEASLTQSGQRAEMVKTLLVSAGIDPERLSAHGLGILAPDSDGADNRIVVVINED